MRFAGDFLNNNHALDGSGFIDAEDFLQRYPGSPSIGDDGESGKQWEKMQQRKPAEIQLDPSKLVPTPEMDGGPYHPGQDVGRDSYIRRPQSGVAFMAPSNRNQFPTNRVGNGTR